jgi:site-specific DNA-methyltransferase (adenine-specific)
MKNRNNYVPDVLDCLANLSSDEVFTPPEIANQMLDMLPQELFQSTRTKFLDPCTKSGVFLREITKRLIIGQIPEYNERSSELRQRCAAAVQQAVKDGKLDKDDKDFTAKAKRIEESVKSPEDKHYEAHLQDVLNHILTKQVFGIAITELTAELSRRSLYCSKDASGRYSVCDAFDLNREGNIRFKAMGHTWLKPNGDPVEDQDQFDSENVKSNWHCKYCGTSYGSLGEGRDGLESHAYEFIHTERPEEIWNMNFDVVIGNPPYQLSDGGGGAGKSASPIYQKFVQQAKRLNPHYLIMITPSRWMNGGKGLNDFRREMLTDHHLARLVDFVDSKDCFPGVDIPGGVSYFLWDRDDVSDSCLVTNKEKGSEENTASRKMDEYPTFIRSNRAVRIVRKVESANESSLADSVLSRKPFGLESAVDFDDDGDIVLRNSKGLGKIRHEKITQGVEILDKWKVIVSKVSFEHAGVPDKNGQMRVLSVIQKLPPNSACTESYLVVGVFDDEASADNMIAYLRTKFVRFLAMQMLASMNMSKASYSYVPVQDFSKTWTDQELYKKYGLSDDEQEYIENIILPMPEDKE